ncbi:LysR family transcriptional regulator [Tepidibacillus fermentans]|uniref:LysR family transcriptional activator of glutamate synthase operon n=1 Tax=Tepidibacillus fermentans TaxID=1281767 RepID=A0A4R3KGR6_9BACI|nr:LysR family transcriptional regulator [Tepidibacillus fermentans]TCS82528.1 LysR family transcriptional activator of glutamate synthase operon [Tepidibacillus fermentans]
MELRQIEYFIEVAKREHVTEASYHLNVAQSAVSRQIANLEEELGVKLFIREGRNVKLTYIGKIFLEYMQQAIKVIEKGKLEIEEFLDPERGTIRVGFPSSLANYMLPTVISEFRERFPHVQFQLRQGSYRNLIDSVIKGEIELALLGPVPRNEKQLKTHILFLESMVALLPSGHPLANNSSIQLSQLRHDSFVLFPEGFILRKIVVNACQQIGFEPKVSVEGDDTDTIKGLVAAGLGVTILPEITLYDNIPRTTVKIPISEPKVTRTVGMIISKERKLSPSEQLFYDFLKRYYADLSRFE